MRDGTPKAKPRRGRLDSYRGVEYRKISKTDLSKKDGEIALLNILL